MVLTPQKTLRVWLLRVLCDNNGRASKWLALRLMEEAYGHLLTEEDRELRVSVNECAWENNTAWERNALVEAGLLQTTEQSSRGVWAITEAGRKVAEGQPSGRSGTGRVMRRAASGSNVAAVDRPGRVAIYVDYQEHRMTAWFTPATHRVHFDEGPLCGQNFKSPSGAARAVVQHLNPGVNPSRNGWIFWTVTQSGLLLEGLR